MANRIGVCSWSLRPDSAAQLAEQVESLGLDCLQLALSPVRLDRNGGWDRGEVFRQLRARNIAAPSGMLEMLGEDYSTPETIRRTGGLRSDEYWPENLTAARECARLAAFFGMEVVSFHAGFLPHDQGDPLRETMLDRLRAVADHFAEEGVRLALETGQETAQTLLGVLAELERPSVGVNFDPANMLLYGMGDPVQALDCLAPHVLQVHIKDAEEPAAAGEWGREVRVGTGQVDWPEFHATLARHGLTCDLMIEREAGDERLADILAAREQLAGLGACQEGGR
ncbi:MAG: sugar phosphate isomerase/epimerase family protein [Planctomycetota bacterium]|jgi:sugar phosphate isomerase/epimerase|nr:sugar phosphate isomerase/epimerase family protein [Planctomycetota bacterium]MDP6838255.1 sugar phosphate isomerase/epimerase family protein [Planctomycetota bacterium]